MWPVPPAFLPGTSFAYTNTGFVLLGRIIEEIDGESLHVVLRRRLFEPLGLHNTYLAGAVASMTAVSSGFNPSTSVPKMSWVP